MNIVTVKDKTFVISIRDTELDAATRCIAQAINRDIRGKNPLFLCILNGAFMFAADLMKKITIPCQLSFVKVASYEGTTTTNHLANLIGLTENIAGRTVIVVEDIIDTGYTMEQIIAMLHERGAAEVRIATLFFKPDSFQCNYAIDYIGMEIPNDFIVGYGLDYDGYGRNLPHIYSLLSE
ncbi:MAG: hypoxanthine phosphoribosyltransferase [Bacteroidales bacterium]|nr:hypoxanthine phosphoribosyltransferase [Bacteroidales bacterium]MDD2322760.1 hypoxanthine phosphoribosyltransferase [Bacteroidales bacterium]MDD3011095.1 hypoxanthine phosphoribosyltransferase [Bacteroidales bacterium]MDD3960265.1 hypoxanthine phosphoribosyltransferase [Bacteroidales bacterium]MDY0284785.1 hypoxanthine phosphoribosyltransferase [Bacteroidales bacterium]